MAANAKAHQQGRGKNAAGKSASKPGHKHGKAGVSKNTSNLRPSIQSKIRGVERLLSRPNLPEEVRTAQEEKLQQLMQQKANRNMTAAEKKISQRYKMVSPSSAPCTAAWQCSSLQQFGCTCAAQSRPDSVMGRCPFPMDISIIRILYMLTRMHAR